MGASGSSGSQPRDRLKDWTRRGSSRPHAADGPTLASGSAFDVIIIGGGVAGLSAAHHLLNKDISSIAVVEANDRLGGRVRQVTGVAPWGLDAGAELVQGRHSIVAQLARGPVGLKTFLRPETSLVYWEATDEVHNLTQWNGPYSSGFRTVECAIADEEGSAPYISVRDQLLKAGIAGDSRMMSVAEAVVANDYAAKDLSWLGSAETAYMENDADDGEEDLFKEGTYARLVDWLACGVPVKLNWAVAAVRVGDGEGPAGEAGVSVEAIGGEVLRAKRVIVAVPLTQMKKRAITFEPALPQIMTETLDTINVNNAVKVWAVFDRPVWKESKKLRKVTRTEFDVLYAPETNYPECWISGGPSEAEVKQLKASGSVTDAQLQKWSVVTAFVHTKQAENLSQMGEEAAVQGLVALMDKILGPGASGESLTHSAFVKGGMFDWSKVPYIEAGYSSPSLLMEPGQRAELHAVPGGRIFFAGEHTYEYANAALQGAMRSGKLAAENVMKEL